ncbi:MAG: hypothetical protein ACYTF7_00645 [Planctomycetota bacterium]|jgi:hypothetical protein
MIRSRTRFAFALGVLTLASCAKHPLEISSTINPSAISPQFSSASVHQIDGNTRDIILSDLPIEDLHDASLDEILSHAGTIIHIHQFFEPKTGSTALDSTASNTSIRMIITNGSAMGVYGGGGIIQTDNRLLVDEVLACTIRGAQLRPMYQGESFEDLLGPTSLTGSFDVIHNQTHTQHALQIVRRLLMHADVQSASAQ